MFAFKSTANPGRARLGTLTTPHGQVHTPAFMPVGTYGSVKGLTPAQVSGAGTQIVLANAYHLMLRPGKSVVAKLGGLHALMGWDGPILTDSGGYQVFSLAKMRKVTDEGVLFRSHIDGSEVMLTPERAVQTQRELGADIIMQLDECPPGGAGREEVSAAVERSAAWADKCRRAWHGSDRLSTGRRYQALFGIQQGGVHQDLRAESARRLVEMDLPGYAIGGLSVGEGHANACRVLDWIDGQLPAEKPRYLMGVGEPRDIIAAVLRGVDMFDCVIPTRNARNSQALTWSGRVRLRNSDLAADDRPIDENCDCYACRNFSRGAIRHLFMAREMLGPILTTIHNLSFFAQLMSAIRDAIRDGDLERRSLQWLEAMYPGDTLDNAAYVPND